MINPQDNLVVHDSLTKPRAGTKGRVIERKKNKRRGKMEGEINRERERNTKYQADLSIATHGNTSLFQSRGSDLHSHTANKKK